MPLLSLRPNTEAWLLVSHAYTAFAVWLLAYTPALLVLVPATPAPLVLKPATPQALCPLFATPYTPLPSRPVDSPYNPPRLPPPAVVLPITPLPYPLFCPATADVVLLTTPCTA